MRRRAVFLDRDGVLNRTNIRDGVPRPPASADELEILPGVREALEALVAHGWLLAVVTNQPDVARRGQTREAVEAINLLNGRFAAHCRAARRVAEEYFDARRVLTDLLERSFD